MPAVPVITRTFKRRSAKRILYTFYTFRAIWEWLIIYRHGTTLKLIEPIFDSGHRKKSHRVHNPRSLISSKRNFQITDRYISLSTFLKASYTFASTRDQKETTTSIRQKFRNTYPLQ